MTPMIVAAINGSFQTAALLLDRGADPNDGSLWETMEFRNYRGEVDDNLEPEKTSELDALDFEKMTLEKGADPTKPYGKVRTGRKYSSTIAIPAVTTSALDRALQAVDVDSIRMMLETAKTRGLKFDPSEILSTAVREYSSIPSAKMIFRTVTVKDARDAVELAISFGGDVNKPNALGNTPLHLAAQEGADDIVKVLAAHGAMLDAKNKAGLTPLDLAMGKGSRLPARHGSDDDQEPNAAPKAESFESTAALLRQLMAPSTVNTAPSEVKK
jgi:ankyrin repeat protein